MSSFYLLYLLAVFNAATYVGSSSSKHPNILLIILDDLRPMLGCYGDTFAVTPNIDALANQGTIFTRAFAQQALCGPSRTSFLTSRRPDTTKLYDVHSYWRTHAGNYTTLPQYFKEHGYHTVSAGKVFHPNIVSNRSDDQPYSWSEDPYHPPTQVYKEAAVCLGSDGALHTNIYCPVEVDKQPGGSLPDIETTEFATQWLQRRAEAGGSVSENLQNKPFFLAVGYHKPHIPLKFPLEYLDFYPIDSVPLAPNDHLPEGLPSVAWNPWNDLRRRQDIAALNVSFPYGPLPRFYARYIRQGYYAAITYVDSLIGDLLSTVKKLFPETIVTLIGDHGWSLGEHQEWSKFSNFEVATRVPFIISKLNTNSTYESSSDAVVDNSNEDLNYNSIIIMSHPVKDAKATLNTNSLNHNENQKDKVTVKNKEKEQAQFMQYITPKYNGLVELVDLFPTLVDLAGLPFLHSCPEISENVEICSEGSSLAPILTRRWSNVLKENNFNKSGDLKMKKAVFSQYPRPSVTPSVNPDSDQPRTRETNIMGYSMRTDRFRYTAWLKFNNITYRPDYSEVFAEELYDHKVDPDEDYNICGKKSYNFRKKLLFLQLSQGWRQAKLL